jgi:hypothetical protein
MYTSKLNTLLQLSDGRFCSARITNEKGQALLLDDLRVWTVTHRAIDKTLNVPLDKSAECIFRELALKDNPRTLTSCSRCHLTGEELDNMLRFAVQSIGNILKIEYHSSHTNSRILQSGQL